MIKKQRNTSGIPKRNRSQGSMESDDFGRANWILYFFWLLIILSVIFSFPNCDSGWSVAGWEVK
tara:strand:+ start:69 stop:260 length:192 start_codon:yes stop_codon:yes gene_type:complete